MGEGISYLVIKREGGEREREKGRKRESENKRQTERERENERQIEIVMIRWTKRMVKSFQRYLNKTFLHKVILTSLAWISSVKILR